jgi:hypothetical protein
VTCVELAISILRTLILCIDEAACAKISRQRTLVGLMLVGISIMRVCRQ